MGNVRLKNVITQNIDNYLKARHFIHLGLKVDVTIVTKKGTMLYPSVIGDEDLSYLPSDPLQVAADNYALLNEGLVVKVETGFEHNRLISNCVLAFYISLSVLIFYLHYKAAVRKVALEERETRLEMDRLRLFKVTSYTLRSAGVYDEGMTAQQVVEIKMFNQTKGVERTIIDEQEWRYDEERKRWLLHSGLPDPTNRY